MDAARTTNAKITGPVPLPTKKIIYCVLKSPHVNKHARFHFEIHTHQRLIDILYPTAQTIDSLMQLDLPAGVDVEVYKIVIKAKLDCCRCHEKIRKAICSLCACEINSNTFDEKSNTITLIGIFDPQKVKRKICQKAGKCIESLEWSEVVKKPDSCSDSSTNKNPPAPPPTAVTDESKDKRKAEKKDGAKEKDKGSKKKKDPPSTKQAGPVVVVVVPPPAPTPAPAPPPPAPAPPPPDKPCPEVIACVPVVGKPVGRCHCRPCHIGCHCRPCPRPGGCSNRCDPCSISSQGCPGNCVIFTEEDTTCKTM